MEQKISKEEWIERYKTRIIKKAAMPEDIATEVAESAFDEWGDEDSPEDSVDSELSYWGD